MLAIVLEQEIVFKNNNIEIKKVIKILIISFTSSNDNFFLIIIKKF